MSGFMSGGLTQGREGKKVEIINKCLTETLEASFSFYAHL